MGYSPKPLKPWRWRLRFRATSTGPAPAVVGGGGGGKPAGERVWGTTELVVAGAVAHGQGDEAVDRRPVGPARRQGLAVVLEAALMECRPAGAVVVVEAVA